MVRMITEREILEDGLTWIKHLYFSDSDVTGGEYCDYLIDDISSHFEKGINPRYVFDAIQEFRVWDAEDEERHVFMKSGDNYRYQDGDILPVGIRVGTIFNDELILDKSIINGIS